MGKLNILIAEEKVSRRKTLRDCVVETLPDVSVVESADGLDAFNKVSRQRFDLVVLNAHLPRRDGLTVMRYLDGVPGELLPRHLAVFCENQLVPLEVRGLSKLKPEFMLAGSPLDSFASFLRARLLPAPPKTQISYDVNMVNAFIDSTIAVLQANAQVSVTKEKIFLRTNTSPSGDISALVQIDGAKRKGSMAIAFDQSCFLAVANRMLGENYASLCDEINDAAAELCNQIFGQTKKKLNGDGYEIKSAIPSVESKPGHRVTHPVTGPCVAVQFRTELGAFVIEAAMDISKGEGV
ncbi:MAG TPA: chemotaxis protein CheX [Bdellovibrionota bacterium]|jgi:CheY-specific phosphatase CheX/CheY-like chemotaxis protein